MIRRLLLAAGAFCFLAGAARTQEPIRFARTPDISPDGRLIAFSYLGDIWTVEAIGGVARPVTMHEAHDIGPVFSPDGRWIAFSSNRHGSYDVFVIPAQGGKPRRLTFDSAADRVCCWTPDGKAILFSSMRTTSFPPVADLYRVPVTGGRETKVTAFEGREGVYSPDGNWIAYVRGPGDANRKGYRGSSNNDLWICKADGTANRQLTSFNGQDTSPMWSADGKTIYFVSEQFGVGNLCRIPAAGGTPVQITHHQEDSVRRARMSAGGEWLVYECGPDLFVCSARGEPSCRRLAIEAHADEKTNPDQLVTFTSGISEYRLSPNEQYAALVVHGEIFLAPITGGKARRLTDSPAHDRDVAWSPDMKKLLFVSDRGGANNIWVIEHNDPEHPELVRAHSFKLTQLTRGTAPDSDPSFSPDGKLVAFFRQGKLWTMSPDGSNQRVLVDQGRIFEYRWSPDSKWISLARQDGSFASEIYLVPAAGGEVRNITRYATRNSGMAWSADGRKLAFHSERPSTLDVYILALQKPPREGDSPKNSDIDFDDIHLRVERASTVGSDDRTNVAIKPDGTQVAFRSSTLNGDDLWLASANGSQITRLTTGGYQPRDITWSRSGTIYFLDRTRTLRTIRPGLGLGLGSATAAGESIPGRINIEAKMKINRQEELAEMFEEGWRLLLDRFYDGKFHGTDWTAVKARYRPLLKHVSMREDFQELMSLMLGELNASHLGLMQGALNRPGESTAELGLIWDESHTGPGLKIRDILKGSPADRRGIDLKPAEYVMAIDGRPIGEATNLSELLNDKEGESVVLEIASDLKDAKRRKLEIKATSRTTIANLQYRRWVEENRKRVGEASSSRLGYIHIRSMDMESLEEFVRSLYSDNGDKDAIVLDVRYNGGGFTHDKVLSYLGGRDHTYFVNREGVRGAVMRANDRRWTRPLILLCNNRSYSDAEILPSAFRSLGLGKLVGLPTGGHVIATTSVPLIDGSLFRIPGYGVYTAAGANMERQGVVPDVVVDVHPDEIARGHDAQLARAVEVLLKDVEAWKKNQRPEIAGTPPLKRAEPPKTPAAAPGGP